MFEGGEGKGVGLAWIEEKKVLEVRGYLGGGYEVWAVVEQGGR